MSQHIDARMMYSCIDNVDTCNKRSLTIKRMSSHHASRVTYACVNIYVNIMSKRNQTNVQSSTSNDVTIHDERDTTNAFTFTTSQMIDDKRHDEMIDALTKTNVETSNDDTSTITLKQIITMHKIKCDSKLIRRVLRKYYATQINHQKRDAWVFQTRHVDDVVALIDKHCRSMKSSTK